MRPSLVLFAFVFLAGCTSSNVHKMDLDGEIFASSDPAIGSGHWVGGPGPPALRTSKLVQPLAKANVTVTITGGGRVQSKAEGTAKVDADGRFHLHDETTPGTID